MRFRDACPKEAAQAADRDMLSRAASSTIFSWLPTASQVIPRYPPLDSRALEVASAASLPPSGPSTDLTL